jgi:hypothetical protein
MGTGHLSFNFKESYSRESLSAARRREAEMSGERRCFRREDEAGGVSKPGGGGGAIRLYSGDTAINFR